MPRNPKNQTPEKDIKRESSQEELDLLSDLQEIVNKCDTIINGLAPSIAWQTALEDFKAERQRLDDTWQYITDDKKWFEFRVTKLAVDKIINLVEDYKKDKQKALSEIDMLVNPDKIAKDVDNA